MDHASDPLMPFPLLKTQRLLLRGLAADDRQDIYRLFSDPAVTRYYDLPTFTAPRQADEIIDRFRQRHTRGFGIRWAIQPQGAPGLIGTCGYNLWVRDSQRGVLGFDLMPARWRQGLMTEALTAVLRFGFGPMQLNRVEALCFTDNAAAAALLQKLGFAREGVLRQYERIGEGFVDMAVFALLRDEADSVLDTAR